jgi:hypothetical protein
MHPRIQIKKEQEQHHKGGLDERTGRCESESESECELCNGHIDVLIALDRTMAAELKGRGKKERG